MSRKNEVIFVDEDVSDKREDSSLVENTELYNFIIKNETELVSLIYGTIKRGYQSVWKPEAWREIAEETWSATKRTALEKAADLELRPQLKTWLYRTALHHLLRRRSRDLEKAKHEILVSDTVKQGIIPNEIEVFDRLIKDHNETNVYGNEPNHLFWDSWQGTISTDPSYGLENEEQVEKLLAPLNEEDKNIIYLAKVYELDSEEIGKQLNIPPERARKRLSRALQKLRKFWIEREDLRK